MKPISDIRFRWRTHGISRRHERGACGDRGNRGNDEHLFHAGFPGGGRAAGGCRRCIRLRVRLQIGTAIDIYFPENYISQGSFWVASGFFDWYYGVSDTVSSGTAGSQDPNQKLGPGGGGAKNALNPDGTFAYRIDFENDKNATAPAQIVSISDALSPNLDWSSFELTEVGFGDHIIPDSRRHPGTSSTPSP